MFNHAPTSSDVCSYFCTQSQTLLNFPKILHLYQLSLLVPPSTANVEQSFSAMNLVCSPLQTSLNIKFKSAHENKFEWCWCQLT